MAVRYFRTYTGRHVHPLCPSPEEIDIQDVAHSLSQMCRFVGHTDGFYSVAQHSVLVSELVPGRDALWGLLHDASEAYLCDLPAPIKRDPQMSFYRIAEDGYMNAICRKFSLRGQMPCSVMAADKLALATEFRDVTTVDDPDWIVAEYLDRIFETGALDALMEAWEGDYRGLLRWWRGRLTVDGAKRSEFPAEIAARYGPLALMETPKIVVGTIHSVKGGQADVVYLFPDLSRAGDEQYQRMGAPRDSVVRLFYVGITRARDTLYICQPDSHRAVSI